MGLQIVYEIQVIGELNVIETGIQSCYNNL